jgi:hypothetical protein
MLDSPSNIGAQVRQRLLNLAHVRGQPMALLLPRYALERLLHRMGISPHRDELADRLTVCGRARRQILVIGRSLSADPSPQWRHGGGRYITSSNKASTASCLTTGSQSILGQGPNPLEVFTMLGGQYWIGADTPLDNWATSGIMSSRVGLAVCAERA